MRVLPLPFVAWCAGCWLHGERRWELALFGIGVPLLAYASDASRRFLLGILPMALLALIYDAMRFVRDVGLAPERVHLCDLRALDMRIARVGSGSVHDYLQAHATPALDIACAIPYGTFIYVTLAFAIWLYVRDRRALSRFAWSFLLLNIAGFVTYHIYPAAAPWYYHAHGCSVDLASRASEGPNLARVDAWLGVGYFAGFYGRSNDVFGAMPSLHVGYPLLVVLYGWPLTRAPGRTAALAFLASMCCAAVYLDHHWIIDVLVGLAYTLIASGALRLFSSPTPSAALVREASGT